MNYLSIDYGEKHLGIAISQGILAEGLVSIGTKELPRIKKICEDHDINEIIIGMPEGRLKTKAEEFGDIVGKITNLPIKFIDETLSSFQAQKYLLNSNLSRKNRQNKEHIHAAILILENYLASRQK